MWTDGLRRLEPLCWRAPSAHNTQPWRLAYGDGEVAVGWHAAGALPAGDPTGRDLRLSLGAFVETCLVVAAGAGLAVRFEPDYRPAARRVGWLRPAGRPYRTRFTATTVRDRATDRGAYTAGPAPAVLAAAGAIARAAGGALRPVAGLDGLDGLLGDAGRHIYADPAVVHELRGWLRLTRTHPRYEVDGLSDRCLRLSRAEALGLRAALAGYPALRRLGLPRLLAAASARLPAGGQVLVLTGPASVDQPGQVGFGRVLMRIWLAFTEAGLACHPLSQLIDAPATRDALAAGSGWRPPSCCTSPGSGYLPPRRPGPPAASLDHDRGARRRSPDIRPAWRRTPRPQQHRPVDRVIAQHLGDPEQIDIGLIPRVA